MGLFGYIMLALFVLMWIVLLVKFMKVVSGGRDAGDKDD